LRQRKFGRTPASAAEWQKQYRYLAARGFEAGQIYRALDSEQPPEE
jgi:SOS response regulatory protein OraA/RecX